MTGDSRTPALPGRGYWYQIDEEHTHQVDSLSELCKIVRERCGELPDWLAGLKPVDYVQAEETIGNHFVYIEGIEIEIESR